MKIFIDILKREQGLENSKIEKQITGRAYQLKRINILKDQIEYNKL